MAMLRSATFSLALCLLASLATAEENDSKEPNPQQAGSGESAPSLGSNGPESTDYNAGDPSPTGQHPFPGGPSPWYPPFYYGSSAGDYKQTRQHPFPGGPSPWSSPLYYGPAPYPYYGTDGYGYPFTNEYQRANPDDYSYGGPGENEDSKKNELELSRED
uniref:Putative secreted protein n=1 Tax=Amblyomma americanum TaxID=6943 RepID=A0A0C9RXA8_AMBAM